jgi:ADP-ribose pyrophosphatase YjhB (NUDIX family)
LHRVFIATVSRKKVSGSKKAIRAIILSPRDEVLLVKKDSADPASDKWLCPGNWHRRGGQPTKELRKAVKDQIHMDICLDKNQCEPIFDGDTSVEFLLFNAHPKVDDLMPEGDVWSAGWFTKDELKWHWKNLHDETKVLLRAAGFMERVEL